MDTARASGLALARVRDCDACAILPSMEARTGIGLIAWTVVACTPVTPPKSGGGEPMEPVEPQSGPAVRPEPPRDLFCCSVVVAGLDEILCVPPRPGGAFGRNVHRWEWKPAFPSRGGVRPESLGIVENNTEAECPSNDVITVFDRRFECRDIDPANVDLGWR